MHFLNNIYTEKYIEIMSASRDRERPTCYCESHHIIPRSLGGNNKSNNLVWLTAAEHFTVHRLLTFMTFGTDRYKMIFAYERMWHTSKNQERYEPTPEEYQELKEMKHSQKRPKESCEKYGKLISQLKWIYNPNTDEELRVPAEKASELVKGTWLYGRRTFSKSCLETMSKNRSGIKFSENHKANMRKPKSTACKKLHSLKRWIYHPKSNDAPIQINLEDLNIWSQKGYLLGRVGWIPPAKGLKRLPNGKFKA